MGVIEMFRRAARSFESHGRFAHLHVRGESIAWSSRRLATDPVAMQDQWAAVLGRSIDDLLDDAVYRAYRAQFEPLGHLRGHREPEAVARAVAVVLAEITKALSEQRRQALRSWQVLR